MTPRRLNLTLKLAAGALLISAVTILTASLILPLHDHTDTTASANSRLPTTHPSASRPLDTFAAAWTAPLRQSLDDLPPSPDRPTPAQQNSTAAASSNAPVDLVGTIGDSLALLRSPDGTVAVRAVGETTAGAEVVAIRPSEVDLRINGQLTTLRKPSTSPNP